MAVPTETSVASPSAHVVGTAFVDQYYNILHTTPESVYRFYQDSSVLTRPDASGAMTSVTTMKSINDMILSLNYENWKAEIISVDSQESYKNGVMVLVTGCLTAKDNLKRKFAQSFFLAPQDNGYFVLNDAFRYVEENNESLQSNHTNHAAESVGSVNLPSDAEPNHVSEHAEPNHVSEHAEPNHVSEHAEPNHVSEHPVIETAASPVNESIDNGEEVYNPPDNEEGQVVDVEVVAESVAPSIKNEVPSITETVSSEPQEDTPKKSYASIVKVMKGDRRPIYVPANKARVASANTDKQSVGSAAPAPGPGTSVPSSNNSNTISVVHEEVEGHSIYIRNLPMNATVAQVEEEFKTFGKIKPGGVQVRSNKGYCFGFVEFEALSSMQSAIEASFVTIGGHQASVEQKRTTSRVVSGRGRFPPNRGGVRNDNFRGRGSFGGGRGYGGRGEFSGRGRGPSGRSVEGYQRVNGRVGSLDEANQTN